MKPVHPQLIRGGEMRHDETCIGHTPSGVFLLYTRYRAKTKAHQKQYVPSINILNNEFGRKARIEFMRRHQLPETLKSNVHGLITRNQLEEGIYFKDYDTGQIYLAATTLRMNHRLERRHLVQWRLTDPVNTDYVEPDQMMFYSITVTSKRKLKTFGLWFNELKKAEEAIITLEPELLKARSSFQILLQHDFVNLIQQAYDDSRTPATLLADISDRNYTIPRVELCGIGTSVRYHMWLKGV